MRLSLPASLLTPVGNLEFWHYLDRPDCMSTTSSTTSSRLQFQLHDAHLPCFSIDLSALAVFAAIGETDIDPLTRFIAVVRWMFSKELRYVRQRVCKPYSEFLTSSRRPGLHLSQ
jgi:hypothetical protein